MQVTFATEAAPGRANEDAAVCGDGWAVVLDGATAPEGVDSGCIHDVPWLVSHLASRIAEYMLTGVRSLEDVLGAAIAKTCEAHARTCDLGNPDSPSSTAAIVRVRDGLLEYLVLADSPVVVRAPDRAVTVISDDRLSHLPGGRPYSLELVRKMRNRQGGFWVASTSPEAACRAVTGTVPFAAGSQAGLFTDGATRLVEFYGYDWDRVFSVLETGGPAGLIALVRSVERDGPAGRGKRHDDATAVLMTGGSAEVPALAHGGRPADWRSLIGM